jgi:hypothetical protein
MVFIPYGLSMFHRLLFIVPPVLLFCVSDDTPYSRLAAPTDRRKESPIASLRFIVTMTRRSKSVPNSLLLILCSAPFKMCKGSEKEGYDISWVQNGIKSLEVATTRTYNSGHSMAGRT